MQERKVTVEDCPVITLDKHTHPNGSITVVEN